MTDVSKKKATDTAERMANSYMNLTEAIHAAMDYSYMYDENQPGYKFWNSVRFILVDMRKTEEAR